MSILTKHIFCFFCFLSFLAPGLVHAWVGEKDIQQILENIASLAEKLETLQKKVESDNGVLLRNQATANSDITGIHDNSEHTLAKLDELTQFLGVHLNKNERIMAKMQEKLDLHIKETSSVLNEIKQNTAAPFEKLTEDGKTPIASLDEKVNSLVELFKAFLETEKANQAKLRDSFKETSKKISALIGVNKKAVTQISQAPGKDSGNVYKELDSINKKIISLVDIMKASIVENSKAVKNSNAALLKLLNSIDMKVFDLSQKKN